VNDFRDFERATMLALYRAWQDGTPIISLAKALLQLDPNIQWQRGWLVRAHDGLRSKGFLEGPANRRIEEMTVGSLTAAGLQYVEDHFSDAERYPEGGRPEIDSTVTTAPAADRLVRFDHNSVEFQEISRVIGDLTEAVRATNSPDVDADERDRVINSLQAAATFWDAAQLKLIQIKIGVMSAVQDATVVLKNTAKAVVAALLVDTIKSFVKTHAGVDLDAL
jgi:hypothetical protein